MAGGLFGFLGGGSGGGLFGGSQSYGMDDPQDSYRVAFNGNPIDTPYMNAIKGLEGFAPKAQWDYQQYTNGYGTRAAHPGETIDRETADQRFTDEIGKAASTVDQAFPNLPEGKRAALTSLTFNAGPGWINSGLGDAVRNGDWNAATAKFMQYNKAGGRYNEGLASRRAQEAAWFEGGAPAGMSPQALGYAGGESPGLPMSAMSYNPPATGSPPGLPELAPGLPGGLPPQAPGMAAGGQSAIPAMAQPTAGQMPPSGLPAGNAAPPGGLPQPPAMNPLLAGFLGFANSRSPMAALGNLVGGIATGHRTDEVGYGREQEQQAQLATYQALKAAGLPEQQALAGALNQDVFKTIAPNIYTKPQWGVVGHDLSSNPVYGWINPQDQTVKLPGGGAVGTGTLGIPKDAQGNPLQGQDLLGHIEKTDPEAAAMVKAIIRGDASAAGRNLQKYLPLAELVDPTLKQFNYDTRKKTALEYSPGGKAANNVKSLETVGGHIDKMMSLYERLGNTWSDNYNGVKNWINARLGHGELNAFETAANGVANELGTVFRSAGMSDAEVKSWRDRISSANSPEAFNESMATLLDMLKTRREVLQEQYKNGMGKDLNPATFQKLDKAIGQIEGRLQSKFGAEQQAPVQGASKGKVIQWEIGPNGVPRPKP